MRVEIYGLLVALSFLASSCSIRPDLRDISATDTYDVIRHVRCELRDAVRAVAKRSLGRFDPKIEFKLQRDEDFIGFNYRKLDKNIVKLFDQYANTVIGSEFTFDITENNNASAGIDVLHIFTNGTLKLGGGGGKRLSRNSVEKSKSIDVFERLATHQSMSDAAYCNLGGSRGPNFAYPITGKLNLEPVVTKFFDYNQSANLTGANGSRADYSLTLKFTTTVSGDLSATAEFPSRGRQWQVVGLDATVDASRSDIHTLTIAFSIPTDNSARALTIAEQRVEDELNYLRNRDDLRTFGGRNF
jgi:hypothetical protein